LIGIFENKIDSNLTKFDRQMQEVPENSKTISKSKTTNKKIRLVHKNLYRRNHQKLIMRKSGYATYHHVLMLLTLLSQMSLLILAFKVTRSGLFFCGLYVGQYISWEIF